MTDREYVESLLAKKCDVVDGRTKAASTVPELGLDTIHGTPGLEHLGMGEFASPTHDFIRADSPNGTRFYIRVERG